MENTVQKMVSKAYEACVEGGRRGSHLVHTRLSVEEQVMQRSVKRAVIVLGFGMGYLALAFKDSWAIHSPLLTVIGSCVCLVVLAICWGVGGLWWIVTGSKAVCAWAASLLPFGAQPYRSASAISLIFLIIALQLIRLFRLCRGLPWIEKHHRRFMVWLRVLPWLVAICVWIAAMRLNAGAPE